MTQQNNEQQGVWENPNAPTAYQRSYQYGGGTSAPSGAQFAGTQQAPYAQPQPQYAGPVPPQPPAPKKGRGWIVALVAVVLFFVFMMFSMLSCTSAISSMAGLSGSYGSSVTLGDAVGIIEISGSIDYDGSTASPEGLKAQLDVAESNPNIKAVVLRVNSGGGTATAGEEMSTYVRQFSKPIVVSSAASNASAAYEISSQADYIFVAKTTAIGAIGTLIQVTDYSGLYEMLGIGVENITSAENKDSGYGTRALTDEERAHYQKMVDDINNTFIEGVAAGRSMTVDEVRALATGMPFTGMDAVNNGLADEIGTLEDAVAKAAELAGCRECETVYLQPENNELYDLLTLMSTQSNTKELSAMLTELGNNVGLER